LLPRVNRPGVTPMMVPSIAQSSFQTYWSPFWSSPFSPLHGHGTL
jgi:hypothetical protein